jgi:Flp pilus assembly CpaF family ATPase
LLGVTLTIRKLNTRYFGTQDLFEAGTLDQSLANRLEDYVLSRKSIAAFSTKLLGKMENEAAA